MRGATTAAGGGGGIHLGTGVERCSARCNLPGRAMKIRAFYGHRDRVQWARRHCHYFRTWKRGGKRARYRERERNRERERVGAVWPCGTHIPRTTALDLGTGKFSLVLCLKFLVVDHEFLSDY